MTTKIGTINKLKCLIKVKFFKTNEISLKKNEEKIRENNNNIIRM